MHRIERKKFLKIRLLRDLHNFMKGKDIDAYLVGGYIRDVLLGRNTKDADFTFKGDVIRLSRQFARRTGGSFVLLDKKNLATRIVFKGKKDGEDWCLDFTGMVGKKIEDDLARRDFTFNAMALDLGQIFSRGKLSVLDPYNGREDLKKGVVRVVAEKSFTDDPLRLLRAFRFASAFRFRIEPKTKKLIKKHARLVSKTSRERIRDELFAILSNKEAHKFITAMDRDDVLKAIFPEILCLKKEEAIWRHSISTLRHFEGILAQTVDMKLPVDDRKSSLSYLKENVCGSRSRMQLLKLACLFHDIGKPSTKELKGKKLSFIGHEKVGAKAVRKICSRLRLSRKETGLLENTVAYHMRAHYLVNVDELSERAISKFVRNCKEEAIELLFLSFADFLATPWSIRKLGLPKYRKVTRKILSRYFSVRNMEKRPRLITGDDLIKKFSLEQGPLIGKILDEVELARTEGKLKTRPQTLRFVSRLLKLPAYNLTPDQK